MPDFRPLRPPACALSTLALTAILAACTTPPPAPVAQAAAKPAHLLPPGAAQALTQRFPGRHVVADSHGPLLAADVDDVAVVLDGGGTPGEFMVAVLAPPAAPGGDWRIVGASKPIVPGCAQCSVSADLAPHGLYVRVIRAEGSDFENFTYQFAGADGSEPLRLVGVTAYIPSRPDDAASHSFSASVDLLTGQRTDIVEVSDNGATVHRERQGSVPLRAPIAFDDFAFTADALDAETRRQPPAAFDPAGTLPAVAVEALRERFPRMTVQSQSSGALRGEGRDIVAVLVPADRAARAGAAADAVVAVLLAQPDGSLRLSDVSGPMAHACPTCDVQVQIARRTLSVETTEVTPTGSVSTDWQFAFRPKDAPLRLVGLRIETLVRGGEDGAGRRAVASTNLINGDRVEVVDGVVNGRRRRSEQKSRVAPHAPVLLSDFAFDAAVLADGGAGAAPAVSTASSFSGS